MKTIAEEKNKKRKKTFHGKNNISLGMEKTKKKLFFFFKFVIGKNFLSKIEHAEVLENVY